MTCNLLATILPHGTTVTVTVAVVIFVAVYALIITEKIHRTLAAFAGAMLFIILGIVDAEEAWARYIDYNTLGLLLGMMLIVAILSRTGFFQYVAYAMAKWSHSNPVRILIAFGFITFILSAFLDNLTTVLLIAPITMLIADMLAMSPIPFLITEILCANIGGAATLIGDPPNIIIGSKAHLSFLQFITNTAPVALIVFAVTIFLLRFVYRRKLAMPPAAEDLKGIDPSRQIKDPVLLRNCMISLGLVIVGFFVCELVDLPPSIVALAGASILMIASRSDPDVILKEAHWSTLVFFASLFVLVGGLETQGVIEKIAEAVIHVSGHNAFLLAMIVLCISALGGCFVGSISFVVSMIPIINMAHAQLAVDADITPLWWALSLGVCLGANGSLLGTPANLLVANITRKTGARITYGGYFRVGFGLMLVSIVISGVYIYLRYYCFG